MAEIDTLAPDTGTPAAQGSDTVAAGQDTVQGQDTVKGGDTVLNNPPDGKPTPSDWPANWQEIMAGGDADELKRLMRYKSPVDVNKARSAAEKKISSGQLTAKLASDATPEQITAWRKDNGIPEKADGYLEKLPKGLVIGDADKPLINGFLERVHGKNASPEFVAEAVGWYYDQQEKIVAAQAEADKTYRQASGDALRDEWGAEFRSNLNSIKAFLGTFPADDNGVAFGDLMMGARLSDGTMFGDNPAAMKAMARIVNDLNPAGFVSPGVGGNQLESVETEIAAIQAKMRSDRPAYDKDAKLQARYMQLITARDKLATK